MFSEFPEEFDSITICPITSRTAVALPRRVAVQQDEGIGLRFHSHIMVDKFSTVKIQKLGQRVGVLTSRDVRNHTLVHPPDTSASQNSPRVRDRVHGTSCPHLEYVCPISSESVGQFRRAP